MESADDFGVNGSGNALLLSGDDGSYQSICIKIMYNAAAIAFTVIGMGLFLCAIVGYYRLTSRIFRNQPGQIDDRSLEMLSGDVYDSIEKYENEKDDRQI